MIGAEIVDRLVKDRKALDAERFIEGKIRLVCHTVRSSCIYDSPVEFQDCFPDASPGFDTFRDLGIIGVEPHAEHGALGLHLKVQFFSSHSIRRILISIPFRQRTG